MKWIRHFNLKIVYNLALRNDLELKLSKNIYIKKKK